MPTDILFIVSLHCIAAIISLIVALRDRLGFLQSLRWGGLGFVTGLLGLIRCWGMDRRHLHYMHVVQDALLNLGMEGIAIYGIPHLLR